MTMTVDSYKKIADAIRQLGYVDAQRDAMLGLVERLADRVGADVGPLAVGEVCDDGRIAVLLVGMHDEVEMYVDTAGVITMMVTPPYAVATQDSTSTYRCDAHMQKLLAQLFGELRPDPAGGDNATPDGWTRMKGERGFVPALVGLDGELVRFSVRVDAPELAVKIVARSMCAFWLMLSESSHHCVGPTAGARGEGDAPTCVARHLRELLEDDDPRVGVFARAYGVDVAALATADSNWNLEAGEA